LGTARRLPKDAAPMKHSVKTALLPLCLLTLACGKAPGKTDAGYVPDETCGIDCPAQKAYGLLLNRCMEYSKTGVAADPADLGVLVRKVNTLEGGVKVLEVEYREAGQIRMTDNFRLENGDLLLARRTVQGGQRIQYQNAAGEIAGVPWAHLTTAAGENLTTSLQGGLLKNGEMTSEATTYKVTATTPDATNELTTPLKAYAEGVKLVFEEAPDHGADTRRIWVRDVGFVSFSSRFSLDSAAVATFYRLQRVREVGPGIDGGEVDCGFGSP
jgi:hypothetical protein